jgi:hypothetical protein
MPITADAPVASATRPISSLHLPHDRATAHKVGVLGDQTRRVLPWEV